MAKKKLRRGRLIYALFLCMWGLLLIAGGVYALGRVWDYAAEYELSRPNRTMDEYVGTLSRDLWDEGIAEAVSAMPHDFQSDEEVGEHVREMLASGVRYMRRGGGGANRANYSLLCGGKVIGSVTLAEDETYVGSIDTSRFPWTLLPWSIRPWKLESESFDFSGLYSAVDIVVPRSYSVFLNGIRVGEEYITERNIPYDVLMNYYYSFDGLPTKVRYHFEDVIGSLEAEIHDEVGRPFEIDPERDDGQFLRSCSEQKTDRLAKFTAGFVDRYLKYTSGVTDPTYGYQRLLPYMLKGSDLETRMVAALDGLSWAHTSSIRIESTQLNGAVDLGEGYYLLDITAVSTTYATGKGEQQHTSNMRVIARERNDDIRAITLELY